MTLKNEPDFEYATFFEDDDDGTFVRTTGWFGDIDKGKKATGAYRLEHAGTQFVTVKRVRTG